MPTGFTVKGGRVLQVIDDCTISVSGVNATYSSAVMFKADQVVEGANWIYDAGIFYSDPELVVTTGWQRASIASLITGDTARILMRLQPPVQSDSVVGVDVHAHLEHSPPLTQFCRLTGEYGLDVLRLGVFFVPDSLPQRIWRTEWEPGTAQIVSEDPIQLEVADPSDPLSSWYTAYEEENTPPQRILGFRWEW